MSSLADSFLQDLDDLDDDDDEEEHHNDEDQQGADDDEEEEEEDIMNDNEATEDMDSKLVHLIEVKASSAIGQFRKSNRYQNHFVNVKKALESHTLTGELSEGDTEYELIVLNNKIIREIDDEVASTHRFVSQIYSKKFPELESLIPNYIDYVKTIRRIGNEMDMTLVELNDLLPSASVMVVSVTGSTTYGSALSDYDLSECLRGVEEVLALTEDKAVMLSFVETRMSRLAPNLCALCGSRIAAQIVGLAGGIVALSRIPSCNVQVIGQEKRHLSGFSKTSAMPHTGILYFCDLVQSCLPSFRRKVLKMLAGKVALVARVDAYVTSSQRERATEGVRIRNELEEKIEKLLEPPKARTKKALPIPEEKKRAKRGGKRVRKMKERYAITEMRQQQNKLSFSLDNGEYGDSAMGLDQGMVGRKDTGKIRAAVKKESNLAKKQKKIVSMSSGQTNGLSSSLVFTPVQGLELVNPNAAADRVKEANNKWFNAYSGFMSAAPK